MNIVKDLVGVGGYIHKDNNKNDAGWINTCCAVGSTTNYSFDKDKYFSIHDHQSIRVFDGTLTTNSATTSTFNTVLYGQKQLDKDIYNSSVLPLIKNVRITYFYNNDNLITNIIYHIGY